MGASTFVGFWSLVAEAWRWPTTVAVAQLQHQLGWQRATSQWLIEPGADRGAPPARDWLEIVSGWFALPFELLRAQHAAAARAGWLPRSALESARFGQALERAEQMALGPLARRR